ncbi:MAG TPA: FkbM family methyltransferase [Gemmatimonadaceae bacterium]|nr:FkbM family methyltransferase [Gemmatimonadaceae bacterium]
MTEFTENQFLNRFRSDSGRSQFGEDGILEQIFEIIPESDQNHWCCEFGAWDGEHCSNTNHLILDKGWKGVLIEADEERFRQLTRTYRGVERAVLVNRLVTTAGASTLDKILDQAGAPKSIDLLSIDVDGNDFHLWASLQSYRPKVVVIEFNPCIPNNIEFVQKPDSSLRHGSSIRSMTNLASSKGYELICVNAENAFYVEREYFSLFRIADNSIEALKYYREPLQVFQLYDGTLVFHGEPHCLYWYSLPVDFNRLQVLPWFVRRAGTPWGGNWILRGAIKLLRVYRNRFWKRTGMDYGAWKM